MKSVNDAFADWAAKQGFTQEDLDGPLHELKGAFEAGRQSMLGTQRSLSFDLGWIMSSKWANRDDLISDIGSPAYLKEKEESLKSLDLTQ